MKPGTLTLPPATHLLGVWLVVFFACALTLGGHLYSPDDELLFRTTESIATSGTLAVAPIWNGFATKKGKDGREYAQYGIGQPILAVPLYWAGALLERVYAGTGLKPPYRIVNMQFHDRSDSAWVRRFAVSWFNVFVGAFFATALFAFAHMIAGERAAAWLTALLYALGTMAWPQSRTFFSEPVAALCVMLSFFFLYASFRSKRVLAPSIAAGCFAGYALLTRLDSILALPGCVVFLAMGHAVAQDSGGARNADSATRAQSRWRRVRRRAWGVIVSQFEPSALLRWIAWGTPVLAAFGVYAILNLIHFGTLRPAYADQPEGISFGTPMLIGLHGFLCSIGRGLFFFSPPLFLFFWAIRAFLRREPALGWGIVASIICFLAVQSTWINWAGGWCWGPRHVFMIHWMLALPIVALLTRPRSPGTRVAYGALLILGAGIQVYGGSVSFDDYYQTHFRDLAGPLRSTAMYSLDDEEGYLETFYQIKVRMPLTGELEERLPYSRVLVAPINDSVYVFQNSQWPGNLGCLKRGMHDFYWVHLVRNMMLGDAARDESAEDLQRGAK